MFTMQRRMRWVCYEATYVSTSSPQSNGDKHWTRQRIQKLPVLPSKLLRPEAPIKALSTWEF